MKFIFVKWKSEQKSRRYIRYSENLLNAVRGCHKHFVILPDKQKKNVIWTQFNSIHLNDTFFPTKTTSLSHITIFRHLKHCLFESYNVIATQPQMNLFVDFSLQYCKTERTIESLPSTDVFKFGCLISFANLRTWEMFYGYCTIDSGEMLLRHVI